MSTRSSVDLSGHTAIVTGANHGIGAATGRRLAASGASVLLAYLRLDTSHDPEVPREHADERARTAEPVVEDIRRLGSRGRAVETDLRDPASVPVLFDAAEDTFGSVDILVNNASAWTADTFSTPTGDRLGRSLERVTADTIEGPFSVDVRGSALLIAEFAERHIARGATWGRIVGLTSGVRSGSPTRCRTAPRRPRSTTTRCRLPSSSRSTG